MAFMAKSGRKRTYYVVRTLLHISIDRLVPVADLISPNLRSSGFPGKPGQEFSPKIAYFWRSKMFLQVCTVGLGYKNSASHVCMIENFKFDHGFCNNFCNNWAKIRQCAMERPLRLTDPFLNAKCISIYNLDNRTVQNYHPTSFLG